jgi:hypothetical protein
VNDVTVRLLSLFEQQLPVHDIGLGTGRASAVNQVAAGV